MSDDKDAKRYEIIGYLATGCTNKEAAQKAGVSLSTIQRLKRKADFKQELSMAVNSVYRSVLTQLTLGIGKTVKELLPSIESPDTPDRVKLKAIEILLTQAANANDLALEQRISEMEKQFDQIKQTIRSTNAVSETDTRSMGFEFGTDEWKP